MNLIIKENKELNEKNYIYTHESGLKIIISPKKGFSKICMMFGTSFGSIVNKYTNENNAEISVPDGIAHFLEHKLFESEEGDAFTKYAQTGGNANAYTSFNHTVYYFSCTDKFYENADILLELMQTPYFTKENVKKEQGIIGQEINMYLDNPGWRVFFNMLQAMYSKSPVRIDIAGTVESISHITPELLYDCYNKFYNANTMCISICGDLNPDETYDYIKNKLDRIKPPACATPVYDSEPKEVYKSFISQELDVNIPIFNLGFKDNDTGLYGKDMIKKILIGRITLDLLFGKSSAFYNTHYNSGLINDSFELEYVCENEFSHSIISGEANNPEAVKTAILEEINKMTDNINIEDFNRQKIIAKSSHIRSFNSPENVASANLEAMFNNFDNFDFNSVLESITITDINEHLKTLTEELSVLSVILPKENSNE